MIFTAGRGIFFPCRPTSLLLVKKGAMHDWAGFRHFIYLLKILGEGRIPRCRGRTSYVAAEPDGPGQGISRGFTRDGRADSTELVPVGMRDSNCLRLFEPLTAPLTAKPVSIAEVLTNRRSSIRWMTLVYHPIIAKYRTVPGNKWTLCAGYSLISVHINTRHICANQPNRAFAQAVLQNLNVYAKAVPA
jgi:hypothetical protein